eukprot:TRINITY_DN363_c0_g1_i10.p1 TRINITY_DN363_c0_g1~~TRINITY_DN363_c0_g1_i10.p1  ORF type:complete len:341 (-),score=53.77 TRINITY_DN363_c0_g1_i10:288-1310(-)
MRFLSRLLLHLSQRDWYPNQEEKSASKSFPKPKGKKANEISQQTTPAFESKGLVPKSRREKRINGWAYPLTNHSSSLLVHRTRILLNEKNRFYSHDSYIATPNLYSYIFFYSFFWLFNFLLNFPLIKKQFGKRQTSSAYQNLFIDNKSSSSVWTLFEVVWGSIVEMGVFIDNKSSSSVWTLFEVVWGSIVEMGGFAFLIIYGFITMAFSLLEFGVDRNKEWMEEEEERADVGAIIRQSRRGAVGDTTDKGLTLLSIIRCHVDSHVPVSMSEVPLQQISAAVAGHLAFSLCDLERKKNGVEEGKFGVLTPASAAGKPLLKRLRDDGFEFVTLESSQVYEKL